MALGGGGGGGNNIPSAEDHDNANFPTGYIASSAHDNRFIRNSRYSFVADQGLVFRGTSAYWTGASPS